LSSAVERLGSAASAHFADLAEVDGIEQLIADVVQRHGRLDILVNAAGVLAPAPFLELTPERWDHTLAVNSRGAVFVAQACARRFVSESVAASSSRRSSAAASFGPTESRLGIPLGRLAEPADEAALALFLAGDGARHITGQNLAVDGGQTIV
jgi:NAD(P)-dependent dehydrogenase (short-subunit alcohol dehydrogenase family)